MLFHENNQQKKDAISLKKSEQDEENRVGECRHFDFEKNSSIVFIYQFDSQTVNECHGMGGE